MELATTTEAVVATSAPIVQHWYVRALYEIFRMKTSSYKEAFILNIMLFVPMGYLIRGTGTKSDRHRGEETGTIHSEGSSVAHRWWIAILICSDVSITIEILQQLTGFGMFDWNDWIVNTVGAVIGVIMAKDVCVS